MRVEEVMMCDDLVSRYASDRCKIFSKYVSSISPDGNGAQVRLTSPWSVIIPQLQVKHSEERLWMACSIYCKRKDTGGWYTPRLEVSVQCTAPPQSLYLTPAQ